MAPPNAAPLRRTIFVISDLHLGGEYPSEDHPRGFRMCTRPDALARFIRSIPGRARGEGVELVINGDFVDFLAERYDGAFRPFAGNAEAALGVLDRLLDGEERPGEAAVFAALREFLDGGHWLTVLLGNHDVELAIPEVRKRLEGALGGPGGRVHFIEEEEYVVGDAHIEHGNRLDGWNAISPAAIAKLRAGDVDGFRPPPGSWLVAEVMNPVKRDHPFIDLLKPETKAAVPVLLALDPSKLRPLGRIAKYWFEKRWREGLIDRGRPVPIAATSASGSGERDLSYAEALREVIADVVPGEAQRQALYEVVDARLRVAREEGRREVAAVTPDEALGWARLILGSSEHLTSLADALGGLARDMSFERTLEADERIGRLAAMPESATSWVVLGHTHLAKRVEHLLPGRTYLNSGTWTDLVPFPEWVLEDKTHAQLGTFLEDMRQKKLDKWIQFRPTFVRLDLDGERVTEGQVDTYREDERGGT